MRPAAARSIISATHAGWRYIRDGGCPRGKAHRGQLCNWEWVSEIFVQCSHIILACEDREYAHLSLSYSQLDAVKFVSSNGSNTMPRKIISVDSFNKQ